LSIASTGGSIAGIASTGATTITGATATGATTITGATATGSTAVPGIAGVRRRGMGSGITCTAAGLAGCQREQAEQDDRCTGENGKDSLLQSEHPPRQHPEDVSVHLLQAQVNYRDNESRNT